MIDGDTLSNYLKPRKILLDELRSRIVEEVTRRALKCGKNIFGTTTYTELFFGSFFDEVWDDVFIFALLKGGVMEDDYTIERNYGKSLQMSFKGKKSEFAIILKQSLPEALFEVNDVSNVIDVSGDITVRAKVATVTDVKDLAWQMYVDSFYSIYNDLCQFLHDEMDSYFRKLGAVVPDAEIRSSVKAISKASMRLLSRTSMDKIDMDIARIKGGTLG